MLVLHPQAEQIWLGDDEIQVLIKQLRDLIRRPSCGCFRGKMFQQCSRERGEEVNVGWGVEAILKIARDVLDVLLTRFEKVDDWDVWYGVAWARNVPASWVLAGAAAMRA